MRHVLLVICDVYECEDAVPGAKKKKKKKTSDLTFFVEISDAQLSVIGIRA